MDQAPANGVKRLCHRHSTDYSYSIAHSHQGPHLGRHPGLHLLLSGGKCWYNLCLGPGSEAVLPPVLTVNGHEPPKYPREEHTPKIVWAEIIWPHDGSRAESTASHDSTEGPIV